MTDMRLVYVAEDRVWLTRNGVLCQARVFDTPAALLTEHAGTTPAPVQSALEKEIASKIAKSGPNEFQIDRGAVDRILEAQSELMRTPMVAEKEGDRVIGFRLVRIRPGSILSTLGLETGDRLVSINDVEVTNTERMIEAYAKLHSRASDRLTVHVVRNGKPTNIDYVIR